MGQTYDHLGVYSDLIAAAKRSHHLYPVALPGKMTRKHLLEALSFHPGPVGPRDVKLEKRWEKNGVTGEWVTWWVGYGPDIAASRAPSPLMVQSNLDDPLFTLAGMKAADRRIAAHYHDAGKPENYAGRFYLGSHKFNIEMQEDAFEWLTRHLG